MLQTGPLILIFMMLLGCPSTAPEETETQNTWMASSGLFPPSSSSKYTTAPEEPIYESKTFKLAGLDPEGEIKRLTFYLDPYHQQAMKDWSGVTQQIQALRQVQSIVDSKRLLLIGNGGAGAVGLIRHLANHYNEDRVDSKDIVVAWRAAHSFENFSRLPYLDSAITYEPNEEQEFLRQGQVSKVMPIFLGYLEIVGTPLDPLDMHGYIKSSNNREAIALMIQIIKRSILHDDSTKFYASRYNHSAMGEKDELLFRLAIKSLAKDQEFLARLNIDHLKLEINQLEAAIYDRWMPHVLIRTTQFPWDIIKEAHEKGLYHINDIAILHQYKELLNFRDILTATTKKHTLADPLTVPAQLLLARDFVRGSVQDNFIKWLLSFEAQRLIETYQIRGASHLYDGSAKDSFEKVHRKYTSYLDQINTNTLLKDRWARWQPNN